MPPLHHAQAAPGLADLHSAQDHDDLLIAVSDHRRERIVPDRFLTRSDRFRNGSSGHEASVRRCRPASDSSARDTETVSTPRVTADFELRRAQQRFLTRTDWAETYHSFSFGEHYDPTNVSFGALMVNNDDLVRVAAGYPDHPHRDAEIITWVLSGSLVHEDSRGNSGLIYPGAMDECLVDGERVVPQPGSYYGGWIISTVTGPFKGGPGTEDW